MKLSNRLVMGSAILAVTLGLSACTGTIGAVRDAEIYASTQFDSVACGDLVRQRDSLAAAHGLPRDTVRTPTPERPAGTGILLPDSRSAAAKERGRATGAVHAMNRSLERRNCEGA